MNFLLTIAEAVVGMNHDTFLHDGSAALDKVSKFIRRCVAHLMRRAIGSNGKQRSKGSIFSFMAKNYKDNALTENVVHDLHLIRRLTTLYDWSTARDLFFKEYTLLKDDDYFNKFYFPETLQWGNSCHPLNRCR